MVKCRLFFWLISWFLKVKNGEKVWKFLKSCPENCYSDPQFAFIGRSNVGKSTLINALANKKIAKTSTKPGRTQLLNFYKNESAKLFVDLPGYGYAAVSKTKKHQIDRIIAGYFQKDQPISAVFLILDARVGFTNLDYIMIEYIIQQGFKLHILANKIDKSNQSTRAILLNQCKKLKLNCLLISAKNKNNLSKLQELLE
ncbi:ribosome biogenesis GTP-binding protein YihA/YsxC [Mesomycoplasma hyopneumoniae]|uniref:ribosome biogenesis GTP-binding protein YihA/YsxC n=1 Tax=Mesomycoplasma hyopneumoniae TaxID=2099 RepID=UPI00136D3CB9|nr:YihA family ribosome biogenesis GTP-binding protein [Mesomycoplasma hyopneumoniae]